jgi:hypothetical protein
VAFFVKTPTGPAGGGVGADVLPPLLSLNQGGSGSSSSSTKSVSSTTTSAKNKSTKKTATKKKKKKKKTVRQMFIRTHLFEVHILCVSSNTFGICFGRTFSIAFPPRALNITNPTARKPRTKSGKPYNGGKPAGGVKCKTCKTVKISGPSKCTNPDCKTVRQMFIHTHLFEVHTLCVPSNTFGDLFWSYLLYRISSPRAQDHQPNRPQTPHKDQVQDMQDREKKYRLEVPRSRVRDGKTNVYSYISV